MKLSGEVAQIQLVLSTLYPVEKLGLPYKALRALRTVLFLETNQVVQSLEVRNSLLSPLTVLHLLIVRAPVDEFPQINVKVGLSVEEYSLASARGAPTGRGAPILREIRGRG